MTDVAVPTGTTGSTGTTGTTGSADSARKALVQVRREVAKAVVGQDAAVSGILIALLSRGHILLEGVPGVAKTLLVRSLAAALDIQTKRVQFTPDLMPGDITGSLIYDPHTAEFSFREGPVFTNLLLADEINRTPPKTQASLLEAMEERQVSVDGTTYVLEAPFMVIATQNPIEMEGTYPLPEAQRDRFTARLSMGYPSPQAEVEMLAVHGETDPLDALEPVADALEVRKLVEVVRDIHVGREVREYVVALVSATRSAVDLRLGASPRAGLQLVRVAKARAALAGRDYVLPDDVQALASAVLAHRLLATPEAQVARRLPEDVVAGLVERTPLPSGARRR